MFGVSRDGIHALKDLLGNTTRIATELKDKIIKATRAIDVEIKKMRNKSTPKQIMIGNPRGNTHRMVTKVKEFARHRCMPREGRVAGKQIAGSANDRKSKGPQRGKASIYFGTATGVFTSVQGLIEFQEITKMSEPEISSLRIVNVRNEIMSTYLRVFDPVKVLKHKVEVPKNDSMSSFPNVLTNELEDLDLFQRVSRIKIDSENIKATELRVAPKEEST